MSMAIDPKWLEPTWFLDSDSAQVATFAESAVGTADGDVEDMSTSAEAWTTCRWSRFRRTLPRSTATGKAAEPATTKDSHRD